MCVRAAVWRSPSAVVAQAVAVGIGGSREGETASAPILTPLLSDNSFQAVHGKRSPKATETLGAVIK